MVLHARGITGGYDGVPIVEGVDLTVDAGEIVGLLGRNGMGKSTLLGALFGTVDRLGGAVEVGGRTLAARSPDRSAAAGVAFLPEDRGVFPSLTVAENLRLARRGHRPAIDPLEVYPMLGERAAQPAGTLSGGQQQQLGIARAILAGSALVCIDELTHGLQPSLVTRTFAALRTVADSGVGVLFVDQNPDLVTASCDRVLVMEAGRTVLDRTVEDGVLEELRRLLVLS